MEFLGKDPRYWAELQAKAEDLNCDKLIEEIATLRAKTSFYEARINELSQFMSLKLEVKGVS
jgi:hypothetical protein